MNTTKIY